METQPSSLQVIKINFFFKNKQKDITFYRSETKGLHHKTQLLTKWGTNGILDIGVEARAENNVESKLAQLAIGFKSSFDELENFSITAKTELQPKVLENTWKIQVSITHILLRNYSNFD